MAVILRPPINTKLASVYAEEPYGPILNPGRPPHRITDDQINVYETVKILRRIPHPILNYPPPSDSPATAAVAPRNNSSLVKEAFIVYLTFGLVKNKF